MTTGNKLANKVVYQQGLGQHHTIACENCSMNAICQPVEADGQILDLSKNYLSKQIPVSAQNSELPHNHTQIKNSTLFKEQTPLTAIYAVCSGVFKLCVTSKDGYEKVVGLRYPGELIGEDALFLERYNYSAIAIGQSSVCEVSVEQFSSCGKLVPELQQNLIQLLSKQSYVRQTNFQSFIGKKSADSLLAAFLINVTKRNEAYSGSSSQLNLIVSRNDVANFLGLRRETLSRVFAKFQKEELIKIEGKIIHLLKKELLCDLANFHS